ncbi:SRPBCC family protein [Streptomyces sp. NPDC007863]|uniref:SRPBCC family protein n=1 Tax=Streptomyces sp. NPDC007863 TaxID=3154894 RepID=UPI0033CFD99C
MDEDLLRFADVPKCRRPARIGGFVSRRWSVEESMEIEADVSAVYELLADVRRLSHWSPGFFAVWAMPGPGRVNKRFLGWQRRCLLVSLTNCEVSLASPGSEFAFSVAFFGLPVEVWGYRISARGNGRSLVTAYWSDLRGGRSACLSERWRIALTGSRSGLRRQVNRQDLRETLRRLKLHAESSGRGSGPSRRP